MGLKVKQQTGQDALHVYHRLCLPARQKSIYNSHMQGGKLAPFIAKHRVSYNRLHRQRNLPTLSALGTPGLATSEGVNNSASGPAFDFGEVAAKYGITSYKKDSASAPQHKGSTGPHAQGAGSNIQTGASDTSRSGNRDATLEASQDNQLCSAQKPRVHGCVSTKLFKLRKEVPDLWTSKSSNVLTMDVEDAEALYLQSYHQEVNQHTLLVVYAPWCPYCKEIEEEVERLATGLANIKYIQVRKLRADSPGTRYFARDVLSVQNLPTFLVFPANSPNFFKYTGVKRDAEDLLAFLNSACKQPADSLWTLQETNKGMQSFLQKKSFAANVAITDSFNRIAVGKVQQPRLLVIGLAAGLAIVGFALWKAFQVMMTARNAGSEAEALDRTIGKLGGLILELLQLRVRLMFSWLLPADRSTPLDTNAQLTALGTSQDGSKLQTAGISSVLSSTALQKEGTQTKVETAPSGNGSSTSWAAGSQAAADSLNLEGYKYASALATEATGREAPIDTDVSSRSSSKSKAEMNIGMNKAGSAELQTRPRAHTGFKHAGDTNSGAGPSAQQTMQAAAGPFGWIPWLQSATAAPPPTTQTTSSSKQTSSSRREGLAGSVLGTSQAAAAAPTASSQSKASSKKPANQAATSTSTAASLNNIQVETAQARANEQKAAAAKAPATANAARSSMQSSIQTSSPSTSKEAASGRKGGVVLKFVAQPGQTSHRDQQNNSRAPTQKPKSITAPSSNSAHSNAHKTDSTTKIASSSAGSSKGSSTASAPTIPDRSGGSMDTWQISREGGAPSTQLPGQGVESALTGEVYEVGAGARADLLKWLDDEGGVSGAIQRALKGDAMVQGRKVNL